MDLANLRKLRLLFEDFPKNHNLVLIGRPSLLAAPRPRRQSRHQEPRHLLGHHQTPRPRRHARLHPPRTRPRSGWPHNTFTSPAVDLIVRSADGVLRQARNLCVGCLIEAVRSANKTIDIDNVNRVLLQPHWQKETDLVDF